MKPSNWMARVARVELSRASLAPKKLRQHQCSSWPRTPLRCGHCCHHTKHVGPTHACMHVLHADLKHVLLGPRPNTCFARGLAARSSASDMTLILTLTDDSILLTCWCMNTYLLFLVLDVEMWTDPGSWPWFLDLDWSQMWTDIVRVSLLYLDRWRL